MSSHPHFWNTVAVATIKIVFRINKAMALAPICYSSATRQFRTHQPSIICSLVVFVALVCSSPFLVLFSTSLHSISRFKVDTIFSVIALATLSYDVALSVLLFGLLLLHRGQLAQILTTLLQIYRQLLNYSGDIFDRQTVLLLWLRLLLTLYKCLTNLPYLVFYANFTQSLLYLISLCAEEFSVIFAVNMFTIFVIIGALMRQLERILKNIQVDITFPDAATLDEIINIEFVLQRLVQLFMQTFQLGIFLHIANLIFNLLANLYALLEIFMTIHHVSNNLFYFLSIFGDLFLLILAAQLCLNSAQSVNRRFLDLETDMAENNTVSYYSKVQILKS